MNGRTVIPDISTSTRYFFVVNPICFDNHQKMESMIAGVHRFFNELSKSTIKVPPDYAVHVSRFPRDAIGAIRRFAAAVPSAVPLRVYAVGGDGILFDCLNGIVGLNNVELGIMPYGAENKFCTFFGIKNQNILNSLEIQTRSSSIPVDAMYCNGNYALSHCMIGLESLINGKIKKIRKHIFLKRFMPSVFYFFFVNYMYFIDALNFKTVDHNYSLWVDGEDMSGVHFAINIINTSWHSGEGFNPKIDPCDGWLNVLVGGDMSVLKIFKTINGWSNTLNKLKIAEMYGSDGDQEKYRNLSRKFYTFRYAKKIFITSENSLILNLDDEIFYDKNITIEIKPAAIRIIVPNSVAGV